MNGCARAQELRRLAASAVASASTVSADDLKRLHEEIREHAGSCDTCAGARSIRNVARSDEDLRRFDRRRKRR